MRAPCITIPPSHGAHRAKQSSLNEVECPQDEAILAKVEALLDKSFRIEAQLRHLQVCIDHTGRRNAIAEIVAAYQDMNKRANSVFQSIHG